MRKRVAQQFNRPAATYGIRSGQVGYASHAAVHPRENNPEFLLLATGDIARSKGMARLARNLNLDRKGLYKAFSEKGNPSFLTVVKVLDNLGFRLRVEQKASA